MIHSWILDCKDRQLSSTIGSYTSTHFSPVIIRTELVHVKSSEAATELEDDTFKIKVAPNINEVVASYLVDEHQLEVKIRIPTDWPLHKIEVKDIKRVGVDEKHWRAWMLGVQQTISASDLAAHSLIFSELMHIYRMGGLSMVWAYSRRTSPCTSKDK